MYGAVIAAAGRGLRMGGEIPKQFLNIGDNPVLVHTVERFIRANLFTEIVLVIPKGELKYVREEVLSRSRFSLHERIIIVEGSELRRESVNLGISEFSAQISRVCIHDGVRPLVPLSKIKEVLQAGCHWGAATLALSLKDTLKEVDDTHRVIRTLPRENYRLIQTPQCFHRSLLEEAHGRAAREGWEVTDDAALVELAGGQVKVVEGSEENFKITAPEDLRMAQALLEIKGESGHV